MTFTQAVRSVLSNYATFSGRALRSEYWWFYLFTFLVGVASFAVDEVLSLAVDNEVGIVGVGSSLVLMIPSLAVGARRLHDTGRTGWWQVLPVIPLLATVAAGVAALFTALFDADAALTGALFVILIVCGLLTLVAILVVTVFLCLDSHAGWNRYGPSPKLPVPSAGPYGSPYGAPQPRVPGP